MELSINQRVDLLVKKTANDNQAIFAHAIGVKPTVINNIVAGRMSEPSFQTLLKIIIAYPQISSDWLLKGEGEMLKESLSKPSDNDNDNVKLSKNQIKKNKVAYANNHSEASVVEDGESHLSVENQLLKQKIQDLEGQVAWLKSLVESKMK